MATNQSAERIAKQKSAAVVLYATFDAAINHIDMVFKQIRKGLAQPEYSIEPGAPLWSRVNVIASPFRPQFPVSSDVAVLYELGHPGLARKVVDVCREMALTFESFDWLDNRRKELFRLVKITEVIDGVAASDFLPGKKAEYDLLSAEAESVLVQLLSMFGSSVDGSYALRSEMRNIFETYFAPADHANPFITG